MQRNPLFQQRGANAHRLLDRLLPQLEVQPVRHQRAELHAQQPALCQQAALMLHHVAEMLLQRPDG